MPPRYRAMFEATRSTIQLPACIGGVKVDEHSRPELLRHLGLWLLLPPDESVWREASETFLGDVNEASRSIQLHRRV